MNSLSGIRRAEPSPYFYTRLQAQFATTDISLWGTIISKITRPVFAFVAILIIILLNSFVIFSAGVEEKSESVEVLAEEYRMNVSLHDVENVLP